MGGRGLSQASTQPTLAWECDRCPRLGGLTRAGEAVKDAGGICSINLDLRYEQLSTCLVVERNVEEKYR